MAAGRGVVGSSGSGTSALAHSERTLPGVSEPSSVVRSIMLIAVSIAQALLVVLIDRVPSPATRASQPTWSTPGSHDVSARFVRRDTPRTSRAWAVSSAAERVVVLTVTRGVYPRSETATSGRRGRREPGGAVLTASRETVSARPGRAGVQIWTKTVDVAGGNPRQHPFG